VLLIAGVRFLTSAVPSRLVHVSVSGAGLMDPAAIIYSPAIRVDYNVHTLERLSVVDNLAGGVVIMRNDVYAGARLASSLVRDNRGTGVAVRGSFFELYDCRLTGNRVAGLEYNPSYTADEALQVRHVPPPQFCSVISPSSIRGLATPWTYFLHLSLPRGVLSAFDFVIIIIIIIA